MHKQNTHSTKIVKRSILLCLFLLGGLASQSWGQVDLKQQTFDFLTDLNSGDSTRISSHFIPEAIIYHVDKDTMISLTLQEFLYVCPDFKSKRFQEEFTEIEVKNFENGFAYTNVSFRFFIDGERAFNGLDHVAWVERNGVMKIQSIHSSRIELKPTLTMAPAERKTVLNNLMNDWHKDVAQAKMDDYFDFMDESFYFLGTDPSERWSREQFRAFCKPYFEKGETWHFIPNWRNWYFSLDGKTAWFEESLDTWMEECRGTGVVMLIDDEWKIVHYNLTVLIENDKIQKFIKLRQK